MAAATAMALLPTMGTTMDTAITPTATPCAARAMAAATAMALLPTMGTTMDTAATAILPTTMPPPGPDPPRPG